MAATRRTRVPMAGQIRLINECRQSGMTDADWCLENDISVSTFYNWVSRCRKMAADQIPAPNYGRHVEPLSKRDVVLIDIVPDPFPEQHAASQMQQTHLDNFHTIEVAIKNIVIGIHNDADPILLTKILHFIQEAFYFCFLLRLEYIFFKIVVVIIGTANIDNVLCDKLIDETEVSSISTESISSTSIVLSSILPSLIFPKSLKVVFSSPVW